MLDWPAELPTGPKQSVGICLVLVVIWPQPGQYEGMRSNSNNPSWGARFRLDFSPPK